MALGTAAASAALTGGEVASSSLAAADAAATVGGVTSLGATVASGASSASLASDAILASSGISAAGSVMSGQAQQAAARYNAQVAKQNAQIATQNANMAGAVGNEDVAIQGLKNKAAVGGILAAQGANNVDVNSCRFVLAHLEDYQRLCGYAITTESLTNG